MMRRLLFVGLLLVLSSPTFAAIESPPEAAADDFNDYPTAVRADYVFGCMAVNGQTEEMLRKCACSIDVIASILPYAQYEKIETILRIQLIPGQRSAAFRDAPWALALVDELRRAQAESTLRCF